MTDILTRILATKRDEIRDAKAQRPLDDVRRAAAETTAREPARDFYRALTASVKPRVIAECKRQSPSRGVMIKDYDPVGLAQQYERGGAAAVSVLTDREYFGGKLADLEAVRASVGLPVLRKDFIVEAYQIYEARAHGADTFLLLSGVLGTAELEELIKVGRGLGMEPLVESHTAAELEMALATSAKILGVNNRDLKTFSVDLATSAGLVAAARERVPAPVMVCESGIKGPDDVRRMRGAGYGVFLVGEGVATATDPERAVRELVEV